MKHLTILVDMDDTIESLASAWVDYLNTRHYKADRHHQLGYF